MDIFPLPPMPTKPKSLSPGKPRKRRTAKTRKQGTTTRSRQPEARPFSDLILPTSDVLDAAADLRINYPKLTDQHCQLAHLIVQSGQSTERIAEAMGWSRSWAYSTRMRADWSDYLNQLSIRALGWAAATGQAVMAELTQHPSAYVRMAAASELMERGGMRREPARAGALSVAFNFSVAPQAIEQHGSAAIMDGTHDRVPAADPASKTETALGGGTPSHVMGSDVVIRRDAASDAQELPTGGTANVDFDW